MAAFTSPDPPLPRAAPAGLAHRAAVSAADLAGGTGGALALYRAIAEQLPCGAVFVVDEDLRYVLAAGSGLRRAGFVPADFEGRTFEQACPPEQLAQFTADVRAVLAGGSFVREHGVGSQWYESHGAPLADAHGRVHAALVVSYDITARKRTEDRLGILDRLARVTRAAAAPEEIAIGACALLEEYFGAVRCVAAGVYGELEAVQVDGVALAQFGPDAIARLARGDTVCLGDAAAQGPAPCAYVLCPHMVAGRPAGITAVTARTPRAWSREDVTLICEVADRAWVHMDRLRLMEALQDADRRKDQFLAVLAREMRNPLNVVRNSLALLGRPGNGVLPQAVIALMERQFGHISRLLEDVLDTSYICYGKAELQCHRLDLRDAVLAAADAARSTVSAKTHTLTVDLPTRPVMVWADPTRLAQAFNNVLANAIKYSRAPVHILVDVERRDGHVLVRVTDNGIGMSARTLARLFELFTRADSHGEVLPAGGLGVGLWITRQLVEAHGGRIGADSCGADLGSTITITLPVDDAPDWPPQERDAANE